MPPLVTSTALIQCSFGAAPASLNVLPTARTTAEGKPAANIMDSKPTVNILPFGMCSSLANPQVAAATAAASGVLTPQPCVPVTPAPWAPGASQTLVGGMPALTADSKCNCAWSGVISVAFPGTVKTVVK